MHISKQKRLFAGSAVLPNIIIATAGGFLPLFSGLTNLLHYSDYPITRPEVGYVSGLLLIFGFLFGSTYLVAGRWARILMEAGLVALAVDLNSTGFWPIPIAALVTVAAGISSRRPLLPVIAFASVVVCVLTLVGVGGDKPEQARQRTIMSAGNPARPALLHIILDAHIGLEGLPADNPHTPQVRDILKHSYLADGFRVYGGAYSRHIHTTNSIPEILDFGTEQPARKDYTDRLILGKSTYLDQLISDGYSLSIYQNRWIDYCSARPQARCWETPASRLRGLDTLRMSVTDNAKLIFFNLLSLSAMREWTEAIYNKVAFTLNKFGFSLLPYIHVSNLSLTTSVQALNEFKRIRADVSEAQPGRAYFAHILMPHVPYVTTAECSLKPHADWGYWTGGSLQTRQDKYADQARCVARQVHELIAALDRSPARGNYIVILHGDHGSRLMPPVPYAGGSPTDKELIAGFSTFFAIKGPSVEPGYVSQRAAVAALLRDFAASDFRTAPSTVGPQPPVILDDRNWRPTRPVPFPSL